MAFRMIPAEARICVPVNGPVRGDFKGRITVLVAPYAILILLHGGRVSRRIGEGDERRRADERGPESERKFESRHVASQASWSKERARRMLFPHAPSPAIPVESVGRSIARKREHGERAAERSVVRQGGVTADRAQTRRANDLGFVWQVFLACHGIVPSLCILWLKQSCRQADARPTADAR